MKQGHLKMSKYICYEVIIKHEFNLYICTILHLYLLIYVFF